MMLEATRNRGRDGLELKPALDVNPRNTNFSQSQTAKPSQSVNDQAADAGAEIKQRAGHEPP
jgi:hypothetical protein